jgi:uncharacterized protein
MTDSTPAGPIGEAGRITNLDALRGVAVFGILLMNAVSYGLDPAAYFNISLANDSPFDWIIGIFGEVFIDQRFMGVFSLLFGAGIVLFAGRADARGNRGSRLSLWRNLLLLGIGALHMWLWEGDILVAYAIASPILLLSRRLSDRALVAAGTGLVLLSAVVFGVLQAAVDANGEQLGELWLAAGGGPEDSVGLFFLLTFFMRALGMMMIGVALFRSGVLSGERPREYYVRMAAIGLGVGLPLAAAGVLVSALSDFEARLALISMIPNTIGTIPATLGFMALIILWNMRAETALHRGVRAAGRMALTNYLTQTIIGVIILRTLFEPGDLNRAWVLLFVIGVWMLQLAWSQPWLSRFRYGPFEWVWRVLTYRRIQPLRR